MFEWEENLFLGLKALHKRLVVSPRERETAAVRAALKDQRHTLFLLAHMIAGRPITLIETPNATLCDREHIFLPAEFSAAGTPQENAELYQLKTLLAAFAIRDAELIESTPERTFSDYLADLDQECPALKPRLELASQTLTETELWELLGQPDFSASPVTKKASVKLPDQADNSDGEVTEIEGKGQTKVNSLEPDDDQPLEAEMPIHTFEKAETLEEYSGLQRKADEEDELEEHAEALRSVEMKNVIRCAERPRSIYRSDIVLDGPSFEVDDRRPGSGIPYPEWNYKKACYRNDWCFIQETQQKDDNPVWLQQAETRHRALILDLKKRIATIANEWQKAKRQPFGSEFDLEAVVEGEVARRSGFTPDELCYIDRHRTLHDVAAYVLMDQSFSTDSWVNNARVLDTICDTILCVGEVLEDYIERFAIAGFSSNTRRQCSFHQVKGFDDDWTKSRARLGGLDANGYTRIGPALRHAQELLMREDAERKLIILITDGRPCDYDQYEGTYGIRDVKKAIEDGRQHGILTHAFAIEQRAREHFPKMFTQHHYDVLPNPNALATSLCTLFMKLKAS